MQNFSNVELERFKTYIDMAKDVNTHRGYSAQIRDIKAKMQWAATPEYNMRLKQDLKDLTQQQIQGEKDMAKPRHDLLLTYLSYPLDQIKLDSRQASVTHYKLACLLSPQRCLSHIDRVLTRERLPSCFAGND